MNLIIILTTFILIILSGVILFYLGFFHSISVGKEDEEKCIKNCDNKKCGESDGCDGLCQGACDDLKDECKEGVCTARICNGHCDPDDKGDCLCPYEDDICSIVRDKVCISNFGRSYYIRSLFGRGTNGEPLYVGANYNMTTDKSKAQIFTVSCYDPVGGICKTLYAPSEGEFLTPKINVGGGHGEQNLIIYTSYDINTKGLAWALAYFKKESATLYWLDTTMNNGPLTVISNDDFSKSRVEKVFN